MRLHFTQRKTITRIISTKIRLHIRATASVAGAIKPRNKSGANHSLWKYLVIALPLSSPALAEDRLVAVINKAPESEVTPSLKRAEIEAAEIPGGVSVIGED